MKLKTWRALKRPQAGFTLIELLVVVLIIGILAAIAVPQYFKVVEKGRAAEALAAIDVIRGAQERYLLKTGFYTATASLLDVFSAAPTFKNFSTLAMGGGSTYSVGLTRAVSVQGYGTTYTKLANGNLSCSNASCVSDLLP